MENIRPITSIHGVNPMLLHRFKHTVLETIAQVNDINEDKCDKFWRKNCESATIQAVNEARAKVASIDGPEALDANEAPSDKADKAGLAIITHAAQAFAADMIKFASI